MNIKLLPNDDKTNGWSAIAPSRVKHKVLVGEKECDWLIIGAGYAGLAAARRLAEIHPNDSIVVIEAGVVGDNASGRNSGFAIDLPHEVGNPDVEVGKRYARLSRAGLNYLKNLVDHHGIQCDWDPKGKLHCAVTEKVSRDLLKPDTALLEKMGESYQWLNGDQIAEKTGMTHYHAGVYTPGTVLLNPAALVQGLADNLPQQIQIYEQSPVIQFASKSNGVSVETRQAKIKAKKVILTVNGFVNQFGYLKNRLLPFVLFASLTKKMNELQQSQLVGDASWGITPAIGTVGPTLRRTKDQRLLIRGGFAFSPTLRCSEGVRERFKKMHQIILAKRFSPVSDLAIESFWMGWLTMTRNGAPGFGQFESNVFGAVGCGGVGVARQTAAGMAIAELASNQSSQLVAEMDALGVPNAIPRRPIVDLGVKAFLLKDKLSHHLEL